MKRVIITGASGFIGSHLTAFFADHGWNVIALSRTASESLNALNVVQHRYALGEPFTHGGDALIHCAFEHSAAVGRQFNVDASKKLFGAARENGIRKIVFVSSLAAMPSTRSNYGAQKFLTEQALDVSQDLVVRPGLVVGNGGLFAAMRASLARLRMAPIFRGGRQPVYTVAIADLCAGIFRLVESSASGKFTIASPHSIPLRELYQRIAELDNARVRLIPLPHRATFAVTSLCERLGLRLPVSAESIRGIDNLVHLDVPFHPELGGVPRPAALAIAELKANQK